jgi:hypothetical protein
LLHFKGKWELQTMMPKVPEGEPGGKHWHRLGETTKNKKRTPVFELLEYTVLGGEE